MSPSQLAPVMFIGHGSPMNAIEENEFARGWAEMAQRVPKPSAVLCVSAHWETDGVRVLSLPQPRTIHDFYGFPEELYAVRYPAPGSPALAGTVVGLLGDYAAEAVTSWGLDHGAWSVLRRMYPEADAPVVLLSLDTSQPGAFHYRLGQALRPLRQEGVMVLGSGNLVHNLGLFDYGDPAPHQWATAFDERVAKLIREGRHDDVAAFPGGDGDAARAIPTSEHYLPLLYALALRSDEEPVFFCRKILGSISMTSVAFGL